MRARRGVDHVTLVKVEERSVVLLLDELADDLREGGPGDAARRRRRVAPPVAVDPRGGWPPRREISVLRVFDVIAWMDGEERGLDERSDLGR